MKQLVIWQDPEIYTYEDLEKDAALLLAEYPKDLTIKSLGQTADGREIYDFIIGNPQAKERIFINGGIHAREYMTSQLVMKQLVVFLKHLDAKDFYKEQSYQKLLENRAIHVVPMINPDGISISQFGIDGVQTEAMRKKLKRIAKLDSQAADEEYLTCWKANGNGVDLNRNFDALWEEYSDQMGHPSADRYKGEYPGSEVESAAIIALTQKEQFLRTISYHAQGSVIYWYFAQEGKLYKDTLNFAKRISALTGYPMDADYEELDPAGYKDWAISKMGIPSLTIEIGLEICPVPIEQFADIWKRNEFVLEETLLEILHRVELQAAKPGMD